MRTDPTSLATIFDGWEGYQVSLVHAIDPLTLEQLMWRPAPELRSVGEIASHVALGRVGWFARMPAPGSLALVEKWAASGPQTTIAENHDAILEWLELSWKMIEDTLDQWTVEDLSRTYCQEYQGQTFAVSYQWTIWRIMTHDIHHGGELALMLGLQGIKIPELGDQFGHMVMPPLAE
jgi:uncharacterized damage-inducible protein DinB